MRKFLFLALLPLAACSGNSVPPNYASVVGMIQTNYPVVKAAAQTWEAANPTDTKAIASINAAIADADPVVASLSATSAPTTIQAAANDLAVLIATPAGSAIPSQTKTDISLALSLLTTVVQLAPVIAPLL